MLNIHILTLFPDMFQGIFSESIMARALKSGAAEIHLTNFRDFTTDRHHTVDDSPFGGGAGMLLKAAPLFEAVEGIREQLAAKRERVILLSPQGRPFSQKMAREWVLEDRLIFLCGHYEGFDDRVRQHLVTDEVSLGDFVMTGGEIAAMAMVDTVVRLLPGVLGNAQSLVDESHETGLLEYPQFTRPASYRGWDVPATLLSGDHKKVDEWRLRHALYRTWRHRPELLDGKVLSDLEKKWLRDFENGDFSGIDVML